MPQGAALFAAKLNAPSPLPHHFLRSLDRPGDSGSAFGLPFSDDRVGAAAFLFDQSQRVLAERGQHGSLITFEGIHNNPSGLIILDEPGAVGTTDETQ